MTSRKRCKILRRKRHRKEERARGACPYRRLWKLWQKVEVRGDANISKHDVLEPFAADWGTEVARSLLFPYV
jgi:hypothetical protein